MDGASYSVEIVTDASGDKSRPFGAYLLFVRWRETDPVATGHLETEFLAYGDTEEEARKLVGALLLNDVKARLDALIKTKRSELLPWWEAMRQEGSS
jgi:hypothetical protein